MLELKSDRNRKEPFESRLAPFRLRLVLLSPRPPGRPEILALLLGVGWYFALIEAIYGCHQLIRTIALRECITAKEHASYWDLLRIRLSGEAIQFLTFTGPFLAEPSKVWLLKRRGVGIRQSAAATVSEYLIYTFTSAALGIAGLAYLLTHFELSRPASVAARVILYAMGTFLFAAICAIVFRIYLIGSIISGASKLPLIGKYVRLGENDVHATEDLLFVVLRDRPGRFLLILAIEAAAQTLLVLELFVFLRTTGKPFPALYPLLIEAATKFVGPAFFFIPGQVGASEGTYALVFQSGGPARIRRFRSCRGAAASQFPRCRRWFGSRATLERRAVEPRA